MIIFIQSKNNEVPIVMLQYGRPFSYINIHGGVLGDLSNICDKAFCKKSWSLQPLTIFAKKLHHRCLTVCQVLRL